MVFHKIARIVKSISFMLLSAQGAFLQKRLAKKFGYNPKSHVNGCTVEISQELKDKKEKVDNDVRAILKKCKNNPEKVIEYFQNNNVPVYTIKNAEKRLAKINEKQGLITDRHGFRAMKLNLITKHRLGFKTKTMIVVDKELDIYILINALHKWYAKKVDLPGFDEKNQILLLKFDKVKEDKIINKLGLKEMAELKDAIARDVQAIDFVTQYSKENAGAKNALK